MKELNGIKIDTWHGEEIEPGKYGADAFFSPYDGYRGNIYNENGEVIGDYHTWDSCAIERVFRIDWNE